MDVLRHYRRQVDVEIPSGEDGHFLCRQVSIRSHPDQRRRIDEDVEKDRIPAL
ncbi:hypothetical protein SISNIDRAFT_455292 [Sistotremastrum niveocremeum HHB9708]|uniref:Uncharacterized protein n=1 Tax=Sistotremastrum niveocremeum HHB9708 TaxID=1314777 RepID=A0A164TWH8_9AGAM|nr:hypothetical protein SISNIDRAFT_455292 [Sistotremastrum niveocremeum HHB9708]